MVWLMARRTSDAMVSDLSHASVTIRPMVSLVSRCLPAMLMVSYV